MLCGKPVQIGAPLRFERFAGHVLRVHPDGHHRPSDVGQTMAGAGDAQVPVPVPVEGQGLVEGAKRRMQVAAIDDAGDQNGIVARQRLPISLEGEGQFRPPVLEAQHAVAEAEVGERVCRIGRTANLWFGVIDGLLKMSNDDSGSQAITFTGLPPGGWFGEGSMLKAEARRYDVIALRDTRVACMKGDTFHWLLDHSIPFNRFIINQINERLGLFIGLLESERLADVDARVARAIGALFHPVLQPGMESRIAISQEEIGYLAGVSRQRVNRSLRTLQEAGFLTAEYGGVTVLDLEGLRRFGG